MGFPLQWVELASSPSVPSTLDKSLRYRHSQIFQGLHCHTISLPHSDRDKGTGIRGPPFSWYRQALYLRKRSSRHHLSSPLFERLSESLTPNQESMISTPQMLLKIRTPLIHCICPLTGHMSISRDVRLCSSCQSLAESIPDKTRGILTNDAFDAWLVQAPA